MDQEDSDDPNARRKPIWAITSLLLTIIGNGVAYELMVSNDSDLSDSIMGAFLGFGIIFASPITAIFSFMFRERPYFIALASMILELILVVLFFHYNG